jgi:YHS domain-containing protein
MLRIILIIVLVVLITRAAWRLLEGIIEGASGPRAPGTRMPSVQMVRDPVCGTFVVPDRAVALVEGRRRLYFCSAGCRDKYRARTA